MSEKKRARVRKQAYPKKFVNKKKKAKKQVVAPVGPLWTRSPGPLHPEIERVIAKPFLATIYLDHEFGGFRYPVPNNLPARTEGLHHRMLRRFFRGVELPKRRIPKKDAKRLPSSELDGKRADAALEQCIRTGQPPPGPGRVGCSAYATAVWNYWKENNHRPILAQLPVVIPHANVTTCGDYFTVHTNPITKRETLHLWELKTGWPHNPKNPDPMMPPLAYVWLTPRNRWQVQVMPVGYPFVDHFLQKCFPNLCTKVDVDAPRI
jgi:hypothetical protein